MKNPLIGTFYYFSTFSNIPKLIKNEIIRILFTFPSYIVFFIKKIDNEYIPVKYKTLSAFKNVPQLYK